MTVDPSTQQGTTNTDRAVSAISGALKLKSAPISLFGSAMGTLGLGLCWRMYAVSQPSAVFGAHAVLALGLALTIVVLAIQLYRLFKYPSYVVEELTHPVKGPLIGQPIICTQLLAEWQLHARPALSLSLTLITATLSVIICFWMVARRDRSRVAGLAGAPSWLVPGIALAVCGLLLALHQWYVASLSFHIAAWAYFLAYALRFSDFRSGRTPVPATTRPLIAISMAPVAVQFLTWNALAGPGLTADILYWSMLLIAAGALASALAKPMPAFGIPYWAFAMPPAVVILAVQVRALETGSAIWSNGSLGALAILTSAVGFLFGRTTHALAKGQLISSS